MRNQIHTDAKTTDRGVVAVLDKGSSLTPCVNKAIAAITADGTLAQIQDQWLSSVAKAPVLK